MMKSLTILLLLAPAGCEKSSTATDDDAKAFVGTWSCQSQLVYKFATPPNTPDKTSSLGLTRTITASGKTLTSTSVTATGVSSGCQTKWTVSGTTATVVPDQTCTAKVAAADGTMREVTTRHGQGTANLSGATIQETDSADVEITQGAIHLTGTGTSTTTCTRKP